MTRSHDYDVLLLDFGGVCLLNPVELHGKTERLLGLPTGSLGWFGPLDPSTDQLWQRMIAGDGITERDYWTTRANELDQISSRYVDRYEYMRMLYHPPTPELVRRGAQAVVVEALAAGYGVSVLTNDMRDFHGRQWELDVPFLQMVDHIVDCSDTKVLKPDPRAFARAVEITGATADRMLFVDDQPRNVDGAVDAGLDAMWFDIANAENSWNEIGSRLGLSGY